jgi:hypothetical protein
VRGGVAGPPDFIEALGNGADVVKILQRRNILVHAEILPRAAVEEQHGGKRSGECHKDGRLRNTKGHKRAVDQALDNARQELQRGKVSGKTSSALRFGDEVLKMAESLHVRFEGETLSRYGNAVVRLALRRANE